MVARIDGGPEVIHPSQHSPIVGGVTRAALAFKEDRQLPQPLDGRHGEMIRSTEIVPEIQAGEIRDRMSGTKCSLEVVK